MIRTAIFDLDGTLADTAGDLIAAMNAVAHRFDLPKLDPAVKEVRAAAGKGGRGLMRLAAAGVGREVTDDQIIAAYPPFLDEYEAKIADETRYFPGVEAALDQIAANGWQIGICTNKPERLAKMLIAKLGGGERFGALFGADSLPVRKPHPRHILATVEALGGEAAGAVMIGDTETDLAAARAALIPCALYENGFSPVPAPELTPDALFAAYDELPALLNRMKPESA